MTAWLLSIVGVVSLGVLLEILLEDGETSKYIKGVFAIAVVLVIVAPLPKFFKKDWDFNAFFNGKLHQPNQEFVDNINESQLASVEKYLESKLVEKGFDIIEVRITYEKNGRKVSRVEVWAKSVDNTQEVKECVVLNINVEIENVIVHNDS